MNRTLQFIAVVCILCVVGCAHKEQGQYVAPSIVPVRTSVENVRRHVSTPAGQIAVQELQTAIAGYEAQVNQQAQKLAKAEADAFYWNEKHTAALKKLWFWRGLAILIASIILAGIGIKTGWKFML